MSDGFKAWGSIFLIIGAIFASIGLFNGVLITLIIGISGIVGGISFFISASFCKILEDTRDTLNRIERILEAENTEEE